MTADIVEDKRIIDSSAASILRVTIPIILSTMSTNLMFLIDRFILAGYSINAMNAACISGNFVAMLTLFFIGITGSAGVFVGQYNGSKQYYMLAAPVWQMIYFSLCSVPFFLILAFFSPQINMLPSYFLKDGVEYQQTLMLFAFLPSLRVAFSAFFIGQGKTGIIACTAIIGSVFNIGLDYALIYGIEGIIPSMGCRGAALATNMSELLQISILASLFFSSKNRKNFQILAHRRVNLKLFMGCCDIGLPMSIGHFVTLFAWYIIQTVIGYTSQDASTVYNIAMNLFMFFFFICGGSARSVTTICSNMIGRDDLESVRKTYGFFIKAALGVGLLIAIPLVLFPEWIIAALSMLPDDISPLYPQIKSALCLVSVGIVLETLFQSTFGVLVAGGDTKYGIFVDMICLWIIVALPTVILFFSGMLTSVLIVFACMILRSITSFSFVYRRYQSMKWYNKLV